MIKKLLLIIICICLFTGTVSAASDEIKSLEAEVEVDSSGTCHVKLNLQVQFSSTAKEFLIPLGTDAYDIYASGAFDTDSRDGVEYAVFENDFGFSGSMTFSCSYSLPCTMTENEGGQYFTLLLPEQGFALPVERYKITVRFPVEVTELPTWKSSYYQEVIDNYLHIQVTENVVTASSNIAFRDHETVTMKLQFQPNSFDLRHLPGKTTLFTKIAFVILAVVALAYWFYRLRSKRLEIHPLQAVNLDSSAGEMPCQLHCLSPDMASLLAHWGNLGYIIIRKNRRGQIYIEKTMDMGNERKPAEQRLFQALFGRFNHCEIPSGRFLRAVRHEGEGLRRSWIRRMFIKESGNPRILRILALLSGVFVNILCFDLLLAAKPSRWFWLVVLTALGTFLCYIAQQVVYAFSRRDGILRLILGSAAIVLLLVLSLNAECATFMFLCLVLQLFCAYVTRFGGRRNKPGVELLQELLGLRRFLRKADRDTVQRLLNADSQYFYTMLPYAEMMGIGRTFARRFAAGCEESCRWMVSEQHKPRNAAEFYTLYNEIIGEIRRAQKPARGRSLLANLLNRQKPNRRPANGGNANRNTASRRPTKGSDARRKPANRRRTDARPTARRK